MNTDDSSVVRRKKYGAGVIERRGTDSATGKPRYYARFQVGRKRHHVRLEATNMEQARAELVERIRCAREGRPFREPPKPVAPPPMTVRQLAEKFKAEAQRDVWDRKGYVRAFGSAFKCSIDPYLGDNPAADVQRKDVSAWREKMIADGKTAPTILRAMRAASVMWSWALELGHLPDDAHNPIAGVGKPKYKPGKELYSETEVAQLLIEAAKNAPALHPIIACAYFTGMRRGELAALRWGDVDFQGHSITVHRSFNRAARKSGKPVVVGLNVHLRDIFGPLAGGDDALVFPDPETGAMRPKHDAKRGCWGIRDLAKRIKVKRLRYPWHGFRSAHATSLAEQGSTPIDIMQALGQSDVKVAMGYTHASSKRAAERVAMLPALGPVKAATVTPITAARSARSKMDTERTQLVTDESAGART